VVGRRVKLVQHYGCMLCNSESNAHCRAADAGKKVWYRNGKQLMQHAAAYRVDSAAQKGCAATLLLRSGQAMHRAASTIAQNTIKYLCYTCW